MLRVGHYLDRIHEFMRGGSPPPVTLNIDPTTRCGLRCPWCSSWRVTNTGAVFDSAKIATLSEQIEGWGIESACVGGGGEPTLSPYLEELYAMLHGHGLAMSLTTSGQKPVPESVLAVSHWVGFSVDAATDETYRAFKGMPLHRVLDAITAALKVKAAKGLPVEITFKYLLFPGNEHELLSAYQLAIEMGCDSFHVRPATMAATKDSTGIPNTSGLASLVEDPRCTLRVIHHRFDAGPNAMPCCPNWISPAITADGRVGVCPDQKGEDFTIFTDIAHLREDWCGPKHRALLAGIDPAKCPHCPYTADWAEVESLKESYVWL